jgi:Ca2+-binding RTX toxin-like protein
MVTPVTFRRRTSPSRSADNVLRGWAGDDLLVGGPGDDLLKGGLGQDTYICGGGQDVVVVNFSRQTEQFGDGCEAVIFDA